MLSVVRSYSVTLALLLVVFVFAGTVSPSAVLAAQAAPSQCCDKDTPSQAPADEGECFNCGCLSCLATLFMSVDPNPSLHMMSRSYLGALSRLHPSGFIQSIDYPPESA